MRIYTEAGIRRQLRDAGPEARRRPPRPLAAQPLLVAQVRRRASPTTTHPLVQAYHQVLLWDIMGHQPIARVTKLVDRLANPLIGKSIVVYAQKPGELAANGAPQ